MTIWTNHIRALAVLGWAFSSVGASAQQGGCIADWSAASVLVKDHGLVTLDQLTKLAPANLGGEIVRSTLCEAQSGFVYKLVIRSSTGKITNVIVDAKTPF